MTKTNHDIECDTNNESCDDDDREGPDEDIQMYETEQDSRKRKLEFEEYQNSQVYKDLFTESGLTPPAGRTSPRKYTKINYITTNQDKHGENLFLSMQGTSTDAERIKEGLNGNIDNTQGDEEKESKKSEKYTMSDKQPYKVYLKKMKPADPTSRSKILSKLDICVILRGLKINYNIVEEHTRYSWDITFKQMKDANDFINNEALKQKGFEMFIPKFKIYRHGVIRGIPDEMNMTEVVEALNEDNTGIQVVEAYRLKYSTKIEDNGIKKRKWLESKAVKIKIRDSVLPEKVKFWGAILNVQVYVPGMLQCYKCGKLGHIKKGCNEVELCFRCGKSRHPEGEKCNEEPYCSNCKGKHWVTDRSKCIKLQEAQMINKKMAFDNVSFMEAKAMVKKLNEHFGGLKKIPKNIQTVEITDKTFPMLKKTATYTDRDDPKEARTYWNQQYSNNDQQKYKEVIKNKQSKQKNKNPMKKNEPSIEITSRMSQDKSTTSY